MTRPPCVRLCPAYPGNPRTRIEGESPPLCKGTYGLRASAKPMRLKGWPRIRALGPSFETPRQGATQGEGRDRTYAARRTFRRVLPGARFADGGRAATWPDLGAGRRDRASPSRTALPGYRAAS